MNRRLSKYAFWLLLAAPGAIMGVSLAAASDPWLADWIAETGEWSARMIILALALTPLSQLVGKPRWLAFLLKHRRAIGVAAFLYTLAHLVLYVVDMGALDAVLGEALIPSMLSGWIGFALLVPLAITSNDASMRALGRGWKRLQRLAYPAAVLTLIHWLLVHDGFTEALLHFVPLALLQAARLARPLFHQRSMT